MNKKVNTLSDKINEIRHASRTGNMDNLKIELDLLRLYKEVRLGHLKDLIDLINPNEEFKICIQNKEINEINIKKTHKITDIIQHINKLEEIDIVMNPHPEYEYITQRIEQKTKEIIENAPIQILRHYSANLRKFIMDIDYDNYFIMKGHIKRESEQLKDFMDLTHEIESFDIIDDELEDEYFREYINNKQEILRKANNMFNEYKLQEGLEFLDGIKNYLKSKQENIKEFLIEEKIILNKQITSYLMSAMNNAENRDEHKMSEELLNAEEIMRYGDINRKREIIAIENTLYKENMMWSLNEIVNEIKRKKPNTKYIDMMKKKFEKNEEKLRSYTMNMNDNDFLIKKQEDYQDIKEIIRKELPKYKF
jgi:hypothetical protein